MQKSANKENIDVSPSKARIQSPFGQKMKLSGAMVRADEGFVLIRDQSVSAMTDISNSHKVHEGTPVKILKS